MGHAGVMERAGEGSTGGLVADAPVIAGVAPADGARVAGCPPVDEAGGKAPLVQPTRRVRTRSDAVAMPFDMSGLRTSGQ